jgi:nitrous oxide reductase accessory protein NosL
MSRVSKYAFDTKKDAQAFVKKHGGKIMSFNEALEVAQKDFH